MKICNEYVAKHLSKGYKLQKRAGNLLKSGHSPDLDVSLVLGPDEASYYQSLIWMIK